MYKCVGFCFVCLLVVVVFGLLLCFLLLFFYYYYLFFLIFFWGVRSLLFLFALFCVSFCCLLCVCGFFLFCLYAEVLVINPFM